MILLYIYTGKGQGPAMALPFFVYSVIIGIISSHKLRSSSGDGNSGGWRSLNL
jgi:hypothetical protein